MNLISFHMGFVIIVAVPPCSSNDHTNKLLGILLEYILK